MFGHWFLVANQKTAKIFTEIPERKEFKQIRELDNPLGRERNRTLVRKQAGKGVKSAGKGVVHYTEKKRHDPHEEAALQFARELIQLLEDEHQKKNFYSLTVIAEPKFLGKIKKVMGARMQKLVVEWVKKDLPTLPQKKLSTILKEKRVITEKFLS